MPPIHPSRPHSSEPSAPLTHHLSQTPRIFLKKAMKLHLHQSLRTPTIYPLSARRAEGRSSPHCISNQRDKRSFPFPPPPKSPHPSAALVVSPGRFPRSLRSLPSRRRNSTSAGPHVGGHVGANLLGTAHLGPRRLPGAEVRRREDLASKYAWGPLAGGGMKCSVWDNGVRWKRFGVVECWGVGVLCSVFGSFWF